jgi:hypothetical protein
MNLTAFGRIIFGSADRQPGSRGHATDRPETYRFPSETSGGFEKSEVVAQSAKKLTRGQSVEGFLLGYHAISRTRAQTQASATKGELVRQTDSPKREVQPKGSAGGGYGFISGTLKNEMVARPRLASKWNRGTCR